MVVHMPALAQIATISQIATHNIIGPGHKRDSFLHRIKPKIKGSGDTHTKAKIDAPTAIPISALGAIAENSNVNIKAIPQTAIKRYVLRINHTIEDSLDGSSLPETMRERACCLSALKDHRNTRIIVPITQGIITTKCSPYMVTYAARDYQI